MIELDDILRLFADEIMIQAIVIRDCGEDDAMVESSVRSVFRVADALAFGAKEQLQGIVQERIRDNIDNQDIVMFGQSYAWLLHQK